MADANDDHFIAGLPDKLFETFGCLPEKKKNQYKTRLTENVHRLPVVPPPEDAAIAQPGGSRSHDVIAQSPQPQSPHQSPTEDAVIAQLDGESLAQDVIAQSPQPPINDVDELLSKVAGMAVEDRNEFFARLSSCL